jgi:hypothetical protein
MKTHTLHGHGRNGHVEPAKGNGTHRLSGNVALAVPPLEPSATATAELPAKAEGRDPASGRFAPGNRFGKGNPHARRMAALREAFLAVATEERMRQLGERLYAAAAAGDWQAAKLFLLFAIGRPAAAVDPDGLDRAEWEQVQQYPEGPFPFGWMRKVSFAEGVRLVHAMTGMGSADIKDFVEGAEATQPTQPHITDLAGEPPPPWVKGRPANETA